MTRSAAFGVKTTLDRLVVDDVGRPTGVVSRGINCSLPAVFCSTRAKKLAEEENKTLLAWWRDLGPTSEAQKQEQFGPLDPLTYAWKNATQAAAWMLSEAEKLEKKWLGTQTRQQLEARARGEFGKALSDMAEWRKQLDRVKASGALDTKADLRKEWNRSNALWYGTMGALAQGLYPTDTMSGKPVFGRGYEAVFGQTMPIAACYEASEGDGIAYGREAAAAAQRADDEMGAAPIAAAVAAIPVAGWIAVSVISVAISAIILGGLASKSINNWVGTCAELTREGLPCPESPGAQVERAAGAAGSSLMWLTLLGGGAAALYFFWPALSAKRSLRK